MAMSLYSLQILNPADMWPFFISPVMSTRIIYSHFLKMSWWDAWKRSIVGTPSFVIWMDWPPKKISAGAIKQQSIFLCSVNNSEMGPQFCYCPQSIQRRTFSGKLELKSTRFKDTTAEQDLSTISQLKPLCFPHNGQKSYCNYKLHLQGVMWPHLNIVKSD